MDKNIILKTSYDLFSKNGFSGTSIKMIADELDISTSLIFHYFKTKEALWISTERFAIHLQKNKLGEVREDKLEDFLNDLLTLRLEWYKDEQFRQFFHWRSLEKNPQEFAAMTKSHESAEETALNIPAYVKRMQKKGLIKKEIDAQVVSTLIFGNSSYAIWDYANYYGMTAKHIKQFNLLAVEMLLHIFKP